MIHDQSLSAIAKEVAMAMSYARETSAEPIIVTPLMYPGGGRVPVRIGHSEEGFLVSDFGSARREADMLGGDAVFAKIARDVAQRHEVRFDCDMIFDLHVPRNALAVAAMVIANASRSAVFQTAEKVSERKADEQRIALQAKLEDTFPKHALMMDAMVGGASSSWKFDAAVTQDGRLSVFDLVSPHAGSVNAAVAKFLDVKDLGSAAPNRIAVTLDRDATPHLALLGRNARVLPFASPKKTYLTLAQMAA